MSGSVRVLNRPRRGGRGSSFHTPCEGDAELREVAHLIGRHRDGQSIEAGLGSRRDECDGEGADDGEIHIGLLLLVWIFWTGQGGALAIDGDHTKGQADGGQGLGPMGVVGESVQQRA
ncbi:MAG: hypothetical protein RMJ98_02520 [Myxococcales bacterium]|nr:hypothetical protein [Polyangiaceae bacterium]MDW8248163.1 hypothetical protein [Myxococcales bacterium]